MPCKCFLHDSFKNSYINIFFNLKIHLLSKIFQLTAISLPSSDVMRRRDRANAFSEAIRALDATGLLSSVSLFSPVLPCFFIAYLAIEKGRTKYTGFHLSNIIKQLLPVFYINHNLISVHGGCPA